MMDLKLSHAALLGLVLIPVGCTPQYPGYAPVGTLSNGYYSRLPQSNASQMQSADPGSADRIAHYQMLPGSSNLAPQVDVLYAPGTAIGNSASAGSTPVIRIVFAERVFFDTGSDIPRAEAGPVMDMIAANMQRDVSSVQVTVLGHTDAMGGDAYNMELSKRRASHVLDDLASRGVNPDQLSAIAIGKRQPVAPNDTPEGRAQNRRVEFLISTSLPANLAVVQQRPVDVDFLKGDEDSSIDQVTQSTAQVLRPRRLGDRELTLDEEQVLDLYYKQAPAVQEAPEEQSLPSHEYVPVTLKRAPMRNPSAPRAIPAESAPVPRYAPNIPEEFQKQELGPAQPF